MYGPDKVLWIITDNPDSPHVYHMEPTENQVHVYLNATNTNQVMLSGG